MLLSGLSSVSLDLFFFYFIFRTELELVIVFTVNRLLMTYDLIQSINLSLETMDDKQDSRELVLPCECADPCCVL